ncbi:MAG: DeoR family transcriptional regulator [Motilibacteraceae bacterium]
MLSDRKAPAPRTVHSARARRELLLAAVADAPFTPVQELSDRFGVSAVTVRSDLRYLEARGRLQRVRGGAVPVTAPGRRGRGADAVPAAPTAPTAPTAPSSPTHPIVSPVRPGSGAGPAVNAMGQLSVVPAVHPALAMLAARLVEPGDVLGLDTSPVGAETAAALARRVVDGELADLTVLTPSVVVAAVLSTAASVRTWLPGGSVSWPSGALDGTFDDDLADSAAIQASAGAGPSLAVVAVHLRGDGRLVLADGASPAIAQLAAQARRVVAVLAGPAPTDTAAGGAPGPVPPASLQAGSVQAGSVQAGSVQADLDQPGLVQPDLVLTDVPPDSPSGRLLARHHRAVLRPDVEAPRS